MQQDPLHLQMNTLGMIGGTSWHSTIVYYRLLNQGLEERLKSTLINPPLLLYSLNVALMRRQDWEEINAAYLNNAQRLEAAGAQALIICANTPHKVVPYVEPKVRIPIIHIAEGIGSFAQEKRLNKLGLLGTLPVTTGDFISGPLADLYHIETLVPDKQGIHRVHRLIADELTQGKFTEEGKQLALDEMQKLKDRGADGIILGCTELPMLVNDKDFELPLIDTTYEHVQKALNFILKAT